jgi:hypothetical protein
MFRKNTFNQVSFNLYMTNEIILLVLILASMAFVYFMMNKANKPVTLPEYKPSGFIEIDLRNYTIQILLKNTSKEYVANKLKEFCEISKIDIDVCEMLTSEKNGWLICSPGLSAGKENDSIKGNFFNLILWLEGNEGEINKPDVSLGVAVSKSEKERYFYCIPDNGNKESNVLIGAFSRRVGSSTDGRKFYYYIADDLTHRRKMKKFKTELIFSEYINIDPESFTGLIKNIDPVILK